MASPRSKEPRSLQHGLSSRQVSMISIAGIIGAGLFIGSSNAIATAGPAILISYGLTGLLVLCVMRMLGEMAIASPDSGSFSTYAGSAIGPWAGFTIGWLYWWFWVLIIPVEAIAGADILHAWVPAVPSWLFAFLIMVTLSFSNLASVKNFGEFEYWFALIKVVAIAAFIIVCALGVSGYWPLATVSGVGQLLSNGGFMPNGFGAVLGGVLVTIFSFFGAEIVTIAAEETENPKDKIRKATNLVVYRIAIFYIVSIFFIVSLVAWNDPRLTSVGSFQRALEILNVPGAKLMVDIVVLVAVTSCMNSGLYTASRMLYSLGARGEAHPMTHRISRNGVPAVAVILSTLAGFVGCIVNYALPGKVFGFLLSTTGAIALLVYLVIAISQLRMRAILEKDGNPPEFKMWLFPWLTWFVIAAITSVLGYMLVSEHYRYETLMTAFVAGTILLMGTLRRTPSATAYYQQQALNRKTK
ncbi:amino acid permease [Pseudomonas sp. Fig-3]|uniref:amino acid permease n=1 Tax=unclassified Pseudomonas TaxID=196821 RepID=UPI0010EE7B9E|nr:MULTISPECIES: amino acid permease [unclassified Pseudomonas]TNB81488.1 amino acid permease [Pseudomonas sp. Fig-3]VII91603.1 gamma-aminobutyrate (GABA) permease [Pseudomonas sp. FG-3G]